MREKVYIVGARLQTDDQREALESFRELSMLLDTLGSEVVGRNFQVVKTPSRSHFFGKGKVAEIKEAIGEFSPDRIVFDYPLSPLQTKNLEEDLKRPVVDRSGIIIEVFAKHASTREGKLQVELAQLKYKLPRLTDRSMNYDQQTGGGGSAYLRGAGERKIELVKRRLRHDIRKLGDKIEEVRRHRQTQAKKRERWKMPIVSLVGYTNAGKSTLLNALTGADILIQDKLFSTLETTVRQRFTGGKKVLFTDTVGFIRNLPVELVAAFRSTLEEVLSASILLVVFDSSDPEWERHIEVVDGILSDLGADHIEKMYIANKLDQIDETKQEEILGEFPDAVFVSAVNKSGIDELLELINDNLNEI